jgi:hypothetical protein
MSVQFPNWDLSYRPLSLSPTTKMARRFLPRGDGDLDYFPRGLLKAGYRVDIETRNRIMEQARKYGEAMGPILAAYLIVAVIVFFASMSDLPSAPGTPLAIPYEMWWLIVGAAVLFPFVWTIARRHRRRISDLLRDAPVVRMTEETYRTLVVRRWTEMSKWRMALDLLISPWVLYVTIHAASAPSGSFRWFAMAMTVVVVIAILQQIVEAVAVWRWSRAIH